MERKRLGSLSAWREWIEIRIIRFQRFDDAAGLSPHGESGLKFGLAHKCAVLPFGLSPHGESGLKLPPDVKALAESGLSPHGESGLK